MELDSSLRHPQDSGDFFIGGILNDQIENLPLPRSESRGSRFDGADKLNECLNRYADREHALWRNFEGGLVRHKHATHL